MIVTFYSFKGGVGRSMALANVAEILAGFGYSVIVCDWDLEAPGLEHYICNTPDEAQAWRAHPGVIDLVEEYKQTVANPKTSAGARATGEEAERDFAAVGRLRLRRPSSYARLVTRPRRSDDEGPPSTGTIRLLTAGRRDGEWEGSYTKAVSESDWTEFYDKWAGGAYFEFLRRDLESAARIVLVDSRTGVTELSGVTTHKLSDLVVLCSAANQQNLRGTEWMAELLSDPRVLAQRGDRPLAVLPVAARIDLLSESKLVTPFLNDFKSRFARRVPAALGNAQAFLEDSVIPYAGVFSFEETVVARAKLSERNPTLFKPYQVLAEALIRCGKHAGLIEIHEPGPEPLKATGSAEATSARPSSRTTTVTPVGEFFLSWAEADRDYAGELARTLEAAGLKVWSDLLPEKVRLGQPIATQIQEAIGGSAGYLLLLPREPIGPWLEAEINLALACQARREGYRVLVLIQNGSTQMPAGLRRFPCMPLPQAVPEATARVIAELLPVRTLTPEPSPGSLLESVKTPTEHESRFFFGRDRDVTELAGRVEALCEGPQPLLIITGPAGTGKTTLLRAGLLPLFQRGIFGRRRTAWRIAYAALSHEQPELAALRAIAEAVGSVPDWQQVLAACASADVPLLVALDDGECLLDAAGEGLRQWLAELRSHCRGGFFAIAITRDASLARLREVLGIVATDAVYHLKPLATEDIREYLQGAARLLGVSYEAGLLDLIGTDATRLGASARTLGGVLQELWKARNEAGLLAHAAYRQFGGVEGALVEDTARMLVRLDEQTAGGVRRVITSLIHGRTGAPIERSREDLLAPVELRRNEQGSRRFFRLLVPGAFSDTDLPISGAPAPDPRNADALSNLVDANIVAAVSENRFRLASDVVPRIPVVQQWLASDSAELVRRTDLDDAATRWHESGRAAALLPTRKALAELLRVKFTTPLGFEFIRAASHQVLADVRRRTGRFFAAYAILLAIGTLLVSWNKTTELATLRAKMMVAELSAADARNETDNLRQDLAAAAAAREKLVTEVAEAAELAEGIAAKAGTKISPDEQKQVNQSKQWFVYLTTDWNSDAESVTRKEAARYKAEFAKKGIDKELRDQGLDPTVHVYANKVAKQNRWAVGVSTPFDSEKAAQPLVNALARKGYRQVSSNPMIRWEMVE
jgi:hypothetical protein